MNHFHQNRESGGENMLPNVGDFLVWKTPHFVSKENVIAFASGCLRRPQQAPLASRSPLPWGDWKKTVMKKPKDEKTASIWTQCSLAPSEG